LPQLHELQLREELGGWCEVLGPRLEVEAPRGTRYLRPRAKYLEPSTLLFSQLQFIRPP